MRYFGLYYHIHIEWFLKTKKVTLKVHIKIPLEIILTNVHMQKLHIARITKVISDKWFHCEIAPSANLVGGRQMWELSKSKAADGLIYIGNSPKMKSLWWNLKQ